MPGSSLQLDVGDSSETEYIQGRGDSVGRCALPGWIGKPILEQVQPPLDTQVCSLGMFLDPLLHLDLQVVLIVRSAFHQHHLLRRLQPFLSDSDLATIIHSFITLRLDYCNALLQGCPLLRVWKLQLEQNVVAYLLMGVSCQENIILVLQSLH